MEMEELQATWAQMGEALDKQKRLTNEIILRMTKQDYVKRLDKIATPEKLGAVVSISAALALVFQFKVLDTALLKTCGVIALAILMLMPYFSLKFLSQMKHLDIGNKNVKDTLVVFSKSKLRYQRLLKLSVYLGFILMLILLPVTSKIMNGRHLFQQGQDTTWLWFLPLGIIVYYIFTRRVIKCYNRNIQKAEELLVELE